MGFYFFIFMEQVLTKGNLEITIVFFIKLIEINDTTKFS